MTSRTGSARWALIPLAALFGSCSAGGAPCVPTAEPGGTTGRAGYALQFCGTGEHDVDRVKIVVDDARTNEPGPPVDVGASDFTLEWWMKASPDGNRQGRIACGEGNFNWIHGNIIFDRDRYNQGRKFGISIGDGRIVFGASGEGESHRTICATSDVADGQWHHLAVQRRRADGEMSLYVDGQLEAQAIGPQGDLSYPDDGVPLNFCDGLCLNSDPYLVIGAEKHDAGPAWPAYTGWLDEVRVSNTLRYSEAFDVPDAPFESDSVTAALWHFDEGTGHVLVDSSPHAAHGLIHIGGPQDAPRWVASDAPLR